MQSADFYVGGPYLHHDPRYAPDANDYFVEGAFGSAKRTLSNNYMGVWQRINSQLQQVEAYEQEFYSQFNVTGQDDFSKKYLVDLRFGMMDEGDIAELFTNGNLTQRIIYTVNKAAVYDTVLSKTAEDVLPVIQELLGEDVKNTLQSTLLKVASSSIGTFLTNLLSRAITNKSKTSTLTFGRNKLGSLGVGPREARTAFSLSSTGGVNESALEQLMTKEGYAALESLGRDKRHRAVYQALSKSKNQNFAEVKDKILTMVKTDLNDTSLFPDQLFHNGKTNLRKIIISKLMVRLDEYLEKQINSEQAIFYRQSMNATGGLFQIGIELGFLARELLETGVQKIVQSVGDDYNVRTDKKRRTKGPSDFRLDKFLIQLKSGRTPSLDLKTDKTTLRRSQRISNLLDDMRSTGLMSTESAQGFEYLLVNYLQRGKKEQMQTMLVDLAEQAVELFMKSDTISSLYQQVDGLPVGGGAIGSVYDANVAQNHFWIVNDRLIPLSSFLRPLQVAVQEVFNQIQNDSVPWYSMSGTIDGTPYSNGLLFDEKVRQRELDQQNGEKRNWYGAEVLKAGALAGEKTLNTITTPEIKLSERFLQALRAIEST